MTGQFAAPTGSLLRRELRAIRELPRLTLAAKDLFDAPAGAGGVITFPGFSTNDLATAPLRAFLRSRGYQVWGWGLGTNRGEVRANLPSVIIEVEKRFMANGRRPLTLVGWSLGGVFAREVARDRPDLVHEIVTMATPIYGGPRYTVSAENYSEDELTEIESNIAERTAQLIEQPIAAFYSRRDGAVDWRACIDDLNPNVDNIEVASSHVGITLDPTVWIEIARRLAGR